MHKFILAVGTSLLFKLSLAISTESLQHNYTLMLKVVDKHNTIRVAFIPGKYLIDEEPLPLIADYFTAHEENWQEVCQMWSDFKSSEEVGCFFINPISDNKKTGMISCMLPLEKTDKMYCSLQLDPSLTFVQAVLVINGFIDECSMQKRSTINKSNLPLFDLNAIDIEFDEEEIMEYSRSNPPSGAIIYAREIGIALYLRSMQVADYIGTKLKQFKRYLFA